MAPRYQFMTGATIYRLDAASLEEALQEILKEFKPSRDTEAVIRSTLRQLEESELKPAPPPDAKKKKL